jgi:hypothetical protein
MPSSLAKAFSLFVAGGPVVLAAGLVHAAAPAAVPPGFTMERTGTETDFDYFEGGWSTVQRRLRAGSDDTWDTFPATLCATPFLEGRATVDELHMPTLDRAGLTLRTFDREHRQWSIYWVNSTTGRLDPIPVVGGFQAGRGEFYASDTVAGRPVKVRYLWLIADHEHARWEQAFSYDDRTWVTNWTADFTRADTAQVCEDGKPKRG